MDKGDLCFLSATELSRLIQSKEVSPLEATEAYLDRIDDLDFKFNSYLTVCREDALQAARQAEKEIARGNYLGPMHGIPFAVKDQLWSKGVRTTGGSRAMVDFVPGEDATPIANMKKAGPSCWVRPTSSSLPFTPPTATANPEIPGIWT